MLSRASHRCVDVWVLGKEEVKGWRGPENRGVDGIILNHPKINTK